VGHDGGGEDGGGEEEEAVNVTVRHVRAGRLVVEAAGMELVVDRDAPDGSKQGFRPVELLLGALGACTAGTLLSFAESQEVAIDGISVELVAETSKSPERVSGITMRVTLPEGLSPKADAQLRRLVDRCKIHNTLRLPPEVSVEVDCRPASPLVPAGKEDA
jgi:putative redox protein